MRDVGGKRTAVVTHHEHEANRGCTRDEVERRDDELGRTERILKTGETESCDVCDNLRVVHGHDEFHDAAEDGECCGEARTNPADNGTETGHKEERRRNGGIVAQVHGRFVEMISRCSMRNNFPSSSMKVLTIILRILLALVLLLPVLGTLGVFPPPTADLYTPAGWAFIEALMNTGYMMPLVGITCALCLVLVIMGKTALAAVLLAPLSVNVVLFHVMLDGTFFSPSAIPAWVLLLLNVYFLGVNRARYREMW